MAMLLDTHTWAWALSDDNNLSQAALQALGGPEMISVSPISIYEIAQKVRLGKWAAMEAKVTTLQETLIAQGAVLAPFTAEIAAMAGLLDWPHRDPFDRILAATALIGRMDFISADPAFDAVPGLRRVW